MGHFFCSIQAAPIDTDNSELMDTMVFAMKNAIRAVFPRRLEGCVISQYY